MTFSSRASGGTKVFIDEAIVVDAWEDHDSTFLSEPVAVGPGYHYVKHEYRSADSVDASAPTNSFATLSHSGVNITGIDMEARPVFANVGWFACANGSGTLHGDEFESGYARMGLDFRSI